MRLLVSCSAWFGGRRVVPTSPIRGGVRSAIWFAFVAVVIAAGSIHEALNAQEVPTNEPRVEVLPRGDVFDPLIADPKEPEFLASYLWIRSAIRDTRVAAVGFGESFGIVRWPASRGVQGLQVSVAGGVFAQFDMKTESNDLLNADYIIGLPITYQRGLLAVRFRIYHQSSHLGDEFLLQTQPQPQRVNLSFESVELLGAAAVGPLRAYFGGEYIVRRAPADLQQGMVHGGVEYRQPTYLMRLGSLGSARLVGGIDIRSWEQQNWRPGLSIRGGVEFGPLRDDGGLGERLSVLLHIYDGPSPYGQFYTLDVSSVGVGVHFKL